MRSCVKRICSEHGGQFTFASACAGIGAWRHWWKALLAHYEQVYEIAGLYDAVQVQFVCEIGEQKQRFLIAQHEPATFFKDCRLPGQSRLANVTNNQNSVVRRSSVFGGGFVCKDLSKQNKQRKGNKGTARHNSGRTGQTYHGLFAYQKKHRPVVTFKEVVQEIPNSYEHQGQDT